MGSRRALVFFTQVVAFQSYLINFIGLVIVFFNSSIYGVSGPAYICLVRLLRFGKKHTIYAEMAQRTLSLPIQLISTSVFQKEMS